VGSRSLLVASGTVLVLKPLPSIKIWYRRTLEKKDYALGCQKKLKGIASCDLANVTNFGDYPNKDQNFGCDQNIIRLDSRYQQYPQIQKLE
jgi:hypothetical protein